MSDLTKFEAGLNLCEARTGTLPAQEMENAMVHLDRMAPNFGKGNKEFRTYVIHDNVEVFDPITKEQFIAYIAHKRDMLTAHKE